jgi:polyhydroxyalkanoate synthesis regulator phasin
LADKQKITNNLETSKSQIKELTIEVEGLRKRIIELQEDQSPNQ